MNGSQPCWDQHLATTSWPSDWFVPDSHCPQGTWEAVARSLFPHLAPSLAATPQDPIHHAEGDVWTHTCMVVNETLALPRYATLDQTHRGVLFYAALLHDISKASTTRNMDGRVIAPGHSRKGAIAARTALWELRAPFWLREQVCRLIEAHQVPFFALADKTAQQGEFIVRKLSCDRNLELLALLAEADMRGRVYVHQQRVLDDIALFSQLCEELGCYRSPYAFPDGATRAAYLRSQGERYADEPVFLKDPFEVTVLSGLPACGKDTWLSEHAQLPVVSYDDTRLAMGLDHGQAKGVIASAVEEQMRGFLRTKAPFVVNATHLSEQMRERTMGLAYQYGALVRVVYLEAPREVVLARNKERDSTLSNKKLLEMRGRWEVPGTVEAEAIEYRV